MKTIKTLLILGTLTTLVASDMSWIYQDHSKKQTSIEIPRSNCPRPIKIKEINDNRDVSRYNRELHSYSVCIRAFIDKQYLLLNKSSGHDREVYNQAIEKAKSDLKSYDTLNDVNQNHHHQSTAEFAGLGCDTEKQEEKKKIEAIKQ